MGLALLAATFFASTAHAVDCAPDWYYWKDGKIVGHFHGCQDIPDDIDGDPQKWCATKTAQIYFSGGQHFVDWAYKDDGMLGSNPKYKCVQTPWYYAVGSTVNGVPNGFTATPSPYPIGAGSLTKLGDTKYWCAITTLPVYVSQKKLNTDWQYCGPPASPPVSSNGTPQQPPASKPPPSATEIYWNAQKNTVNSLLNTLRADTLEMMNVHAGLKQEIDSTMEPLITSILASKKISTPPVAVNKAAYLTAALKQQSDLKQLIQIITDTLQKDVDIPNLNVDVLTDAATAYFNALFIVSVKKPLLDSGKTACKLDLMGDQLIYKYMTGPGLGNKAYKSYSTYDPNLSNIISDIHCLDQPTVNMLDQALTNAYLFTMAAVKADHPSPTYTTAVQDYLFSRLAAIFISVYERTRFQGAYVTSRIFMQQFADRLKAVPSGKTSAPDDPNVILIPDVMLVYNSWLQLASPALICSSHAKWLPSDQLSGMGNEVWNTSSNCMNFPNFIKTIMDPKMDGDGTCPYMGTATMGKPCVPAAPPKTSWLDSEKIRNSISNFFESLFISTAYAAPAGTSCENDCATSQKNCAESNYTWADCPGDENKDCKPPHCDVIYCKIKVPDPSCDTQYKSCSLKCKKNKCGDGNVDMDSDEQCDDGNTKSGDGCSATCQTEDSCENKCFKQNPDCQLSHSIWESYKSDPNYTVSNTPWDGLGCTFTPYKAGASGIVAANILAKECRGDPTLQVCLSKCPAEAAPLPDECSYLIAKQPTWENGFGSPVGNPPISPTIKNAFIDQGNSLFATKWSDVVSALEGILGVSLPKNDTDMAMAFGMQTLGAAQECKGDDLKFVQTYPPAGAEAMTSTHICWNPTYVNQDTFAEEAPKLGAHEAIHAAMNYLDQHGYHDIFSANTPNKSETNCGFDKLGLDTMAPGWLEHWIMQILPGSSTMPIPFQGQLGLKTEVCGPPVWEN